MAEPSSLPHSPSSPPSERSSGEDFPELPSSLKDRGVELGIVLSIQPLSSRPPATLDTGSSTDISPESSDNPVQTPESSPTTNSQLGLVMNPPNPLFNLVVISLQRP